LRTRASRSASLAGIKTLSLSNADKASVPSVVEAAVSAHATTGKNRSPLVLDVATNTIDEPGSPLQVEVTLKTTVKSMFGPRFGLGNASIEVKSVAIVVGKPNICLLALDPSAMDTLYLQKNAKIIGQNCTVYSNSTHPNGIKAFNSSSLSAATICPAGGKGNFQPDPLTGCPQFDDPLAGRPEPSVGPCTNTNLVLNSVTTQLSPGTCCGGVTIKGSAQVTLNPGIYVMKDGPLLVRDTATITGDNIGLFLPGTNARFSFATGSTVSLTAPKDGPMAGMLMFGARSQSGMVHEILSDNARQLLGTIYLPTGELSIDANKPIADQSAYTAIVAQKVLANSGPTVTLNTNYDQTTCPYRTAYAAPANP
jgi:hypothetical protein